MIKGSPPYLTELGQVTQGVGRGDTPEETMCPLPSLRGAVV